MPNFSNKQNGKEVGQASVYAQPHDMSGKPLNTSDVGKRGEMPRKENWTPMEGVSIGDTGPVKTTGIQIRGTGCATKGVTARGPMA